MDLSKLDLQEPASRGAKMTVCHPVTGEELETDGAPMTITLMGSDSPAYRQHIRNAANKNFSRGRKGLTPEQLEQEAVKMLAAMTMEWSGIIEDGVAVEYSSQAARKLYTDYTWIREQVDEFVGDRANFLTAA